MKKITWLMITLGIILVLSVVVSGSWIRTEGGVQATADEGFCGRCHSMRPFVETHALDVHGGANTKGLRAQCADCHLPHAGPATYLIAKARTGLWDVWAEVLTVFRTPDWIDKLEHRTDFVYDSGCRSCHARLAEAPNQTPTAAFGHKTYFASGGAMHCVTCHTQVGHRDLMARLTPSAADTSAQSGQPVATQEQSQ